MDLFQISKGSGIYHLSSLWAMLSPRLAGQDKPLPPICDDSDSISDAARDNPRQEIEPNDSYQD